MLGEGPCALHADVAEVPHVFAAKSHPPPSSILATFFEQLLEGSQASVEEVQRLER